MAGKLLVPIRFPHADVLDGGGYRIVGTVTELGVVGKYRVRLFERITGRFLRETWSDPVTGAYSFEYVAYRDQGYLVVAHDHGASPQNAAAADFVTPEAMP